MDLRFACTQCGRCCHDLKLPLSAAEASDWLARGHAVHILCEAIPWPGEPPSSDLQAAYKRRRSFEVLSGTMPARVIVTFAASFDGACPHLGADMRCGIYDSRPRVCRIYPAELNPFLTLTPSEKRCPPDAWDERQAPLIVGGVLVDDATRMAIAESRAAVEADVPIKARVCDALGIREAAMSNQGFVSFAPSPAAMSEALARSMRSDAQGPRSDWQFITTHADTLDALVSIGARASPPSGDGYSFLGAAAA